jgi:hypothetical protein
MIKSFPTTLPGSEKLSLIDLNTLVVVPGVNSRYDGAKRPFSAVDRRTQYGQLIII